jgi:hypothetical protein
MAGLYALSTNLIHQEIDHSRKSFRGNAAVPPTPSDAVTNLHLHDPVIVMYNTDGSNG